MSPTGPNAPSGGANVLQQYLTWFGFSYNSEALSEFQQKIGMVTKAAAVGFAVVAASSYALVKAGETLFGFAANTAEIGFEATNTAQKIGVSSQAIQELSYAAKMSGGSIKNLIQGVAQLHRRTFEAANGNKQFAQSFALAGIAVKDSSGNLRSADAILSEVADAVAKTEDPAKREAIAFRLMGRAGVQLLPILAHGAKGIQRLRAEAIELGAVMGPQTTKAATELKYEMLRLDAVWEGLKLRLGAALIPTMMQFVEGIVTWVRRNRELINSTIAVIAAVGGGLFSVITGFFGFLLEHIPFLAAFVGLLGVGLVAACVAGGMALNSMTASMLAFMGIEFGILSPLLVIIATLLILAVVIDEVVSTILGYDTLITRILHVTDIKPEDHPLIKFLKMVTLEAARALNSLNPFRGTMDSVLHFGEDLANLFNGSAGADRLDRKAAYLKALDAEQDPVKKAAMWDAYSNDPGAAADDYQRSMGSENFMRTDVNGGAAAGGAARSVNTSVTVAPQITQNFNGAADPEAVKEAASSGVESSSNMAQSYLDHALGQVSSNTERL